MSLPKTLAVIPELRAVLAAHPNGIEPSRVYDELASRMSLRADDLEDKLSDGVRLRWPNRVQAAREKMVQAGEIHRRPHGRWRLTEKGRRLAMTVLKAPVEGDEAHAIVELLGSTRKATDREQLILARLGQGDFRRALIERDGACRLCNMNKHELLIASHIKPWRDANNKERLDPSNGLLLCPNADRLFDRGYISFSDEGALLLSNHLDVQSRKMLCAHAAVRLPESSVTRYLAYHRQRVFRG